MVPGSRPTVKCPWPMVENFKMCSLSSPKAMVPSSSKESAPVTRHSQSKNARSPSNGLTSALTPDDLTVVVTTQPVAMLVERSDLESPALDETRPLKCIVYRSFFMCRRAALPRQPESCSWWSISSVSAAIRTLGVLKARRSNGRTVLLLDASPSGMHYSCPALRVCGSYRNRPADANKRARFASIPSARDF